MVVGEELQCLKEIALLGGCRSPVCVSSQMLGSILDISPQTASRRLISLEKQRLVTRALRPDGQYVAITGEGEELLRHQYSEYCRIFGEQSGHLSLEGEVIDGLGEGRYYVSVPGYVSQFIEKLGFEPFPGTLNIRLTPESIVIRKKADALHWVAIGGFTANERTFGGARCLPCNIEGHPCAIIVPGRTHYPEDIIEVISPVQLRDTLGPDGGSHVSVDVIEND